MKGTDMTRTISWLDLTLKTKAVSPAAEAQQAHDEKAVAAMRKQLAKRPKPDGEVKDLLDDKERRYSVRAGVRIGQAAQPIIRLDYVSECRGHQC